MLNVVTKLSIAVVLILTVLFSVYVSNSYAAESIQATLWAPNEVLPKQTYQGLIVIEDKTDSDVIFDVITDNDEVVEILTKQVTIPKTKHHGIITFETRATGNAEIFAVYKDKLLQQNIEVLESAETATELDLILPSDVVNVLASDDILTGYVFLLNDFGNPVIVKDPIKIDLTSDGEIVLTKNSVSIEPGKHYAKFAFKARGDGSITATAPNLEPDEEDLSISDPDEIEFNIKVAPDPIPTDSPVEIFYWLERDGRPYLVPHDIKVTITIGESANLSFDSAMEGAIVLTPNTQDRRTEDTGAREIITRTENQLAFDSKKEVILKKGQHYGKIRAYATFDAASDIKISGLAESIRPGPDEETIKENEIVTVSSEKSNFDIATETKVFAYPDPAYDKVEIIVSSQSDDGPVIEDDDEDFTVFTSNQITLESSKMVILTDTNYSIITAIVNDVGDVDIFAQRNEAEGEEIIIETLGKYVKESQLSVTSLPVIFGVEQDLFLVTSAHDKITTNSDNNEEDTVLVSITSKPSFPFETVRESESIITAKGKLSYLSEDTSEDPEINVASNADTEDETLEIYNPNRKRIMSDIPPSVFPEEPFPIVNHVTDLEDNPIQVANLKISSDADMNVIDGLVYINETGSHTLIFYDYNTVPVESSINVKGAISKVSAQQETEKSTRTTVTYDIQVEEGSGSGTYEEDEEVIISASSTKDDMFLIKKKLVGWENLPYKEPEVMFNADSNVETKPIYETDYTMIFTVIGPVVGVGTLVFIKKYKNKQNHEEDQEEIDDDDDEEMEDLQN